MIQSHKDLIKLCEQGVVSHTKWKNRDTPEAQQQLGICWALLKAGCPFRVTELDSDFINLMIAHPTFSTIENGDSEMEWSTFYIPTQQKLNAMKGRDWY